MEDFPSIYTAYKDRVYNQAFCMLGSPHETEEAVQDIFLRIYNGLPKFRGDAKLSTWIYRIAANVCINRWKRRKHTHLSLDDDYVHKQAVASHVMPSSDACYESKEFQQRVRKCLSQLKPDYSLVVTLHYFEGLRYKEIAQIADIPIGTVSTNLHHAKKALRSLLKKEFSDEM